MAKAQSVPEPIRVMLIGKTGCGKSALANTLLGFRKFKSIPAEESVRLECEVGTVDLPSGIKIKVVEIPGTKYRDEELVITKCISLLSPGPHAIIIVLQPNRATEEERRVIKDLTELFGNDEFLAYTLIVMVRRNEIRDTDGDLIDIHEFMNTMATDDVKSLYTQCGKRVIAVENLASPTEKQQYAQQIIEEISTMDGYYSHEYFEQLQELKLKEVQVADLQKALCERADKNNRPLCSIL